MRMLLPLLLVAFTTSAATHNNNDSCDISVAPAATLLLPYFEVDPVGGTKTTIFTVTNVTATPQIAAVTLWTDYGAPVLRFNLFLTGYDVEPINLFDVFGKGLIANHNANASTGDRSRPNDGNPNFLPHALSGCTNAPLRMPEAMRQAFVRIFTTGVAGAPWPSCDFLGNGRRANAIGYATIDVVGNCGYGFPTQPPYFDEVLYDNVLTGDYEQVDAQRVTAAGAPLVHIRAIPEGGPAGTHAPSDLGLTFYDRLVAPPRSDRRQPLPAIFAIRVFRGAFSSTLRYWREPRTGAGATCNDYRDKGYSFIANAVEFDEHENATVGTCPPSLGEGLPPFTFVVDRGAERALCSNPSPDSGGWLYIDLNDGGPRQSQNWVVAELTAGGLSVQLDPTILGNGCSPPPPKGNIIVGPLPHTNP